MCAATLRRARLLAARRRCAGAPCCTTPSTAGARALPRRRGLRARLPELLPDRDDLSVHVGRGPPAVTGNTYYPVKIIIHTKNCSWVLEFVPLHPRSGGEEVRGGGESLTFQGERGRRGRRPG